MSRRQVMSTEKLFLITMIVNVVVLVTLFTRPSCPVIQAVASRHLVTADIVRTVGSRSADNDRSCSLQMQFLRRENSSRSGEPPLLCIFTSFKPNPLKLAVYNNTLYNWASLDYRPISRVITVLYMSPADMDAVPSLISTARCLGWTVLPVPRDSMTSRLPYIKDMYSDVSRRFTDCTFYAFSNGDILFDRGLVKALEAVDKKQKELGRTMLIGQRYNVPWSNKSAPIYVPEEIRNIARRYGKLFNVAAEDFFIIYRNEYPWNRVPSELVVARRGYDNFLVAVAINDSMSVVDVTKTVTAVHQTDAEGDHAGKNVVDNVDFNVDLIGSKFNFENGFTTCSQYITTWQVSNRTTTAAVIERQNRPRTHKCLNPGRRRGPGRRRRLHHATAASRSSTKPH